MKWLNRLKMAQKLGFGFGLCLFLTFISGSVAIQKMAFMNNNTSSIVNGPMTMITDLGILQANIKQYRIQQLRFTLADTATEKKNTIKDIETERNNAQQTLAEIRQNSSSLAEKSAYGKLDAAWRSYTSYNQAVISASYAKDLKKSDKILNHDARTPWLALRHLVEGMIASEIKSGSEMASHARESYHNSIKTTLTLLVLSLFFALCIAFAISKNTVDESEKSIVRLEELTQREMSSIKGAVHALMSGDLTAKIETRPRLLETSGNSEFARLAASVNHISNIIEEVAEGFHQSQVSLIEMLAQTRDAADSIASSSSELASGSQDLSVRTTQQAASLETTASSMEEIMGLVKSSAENASNANAIAGHTRKVAQSGGDVVESAVTSMQSVNEASKKIADIISVIDEIAFQTNLLALNASVEAARVGEHGKGFAVVASEVRNLAARSSSAAKKIKELVTDTVHKVDEGSKHVERSGQQLKEIVAAVEQVAGMVSGISSSAQEQAIGIEQVNKAVIQIDNITQQNAAMAEEVAATSRAMSDQAQDLKSLVRRFVLNRSDALQDASPRMEIEESEDAPSDRAA